MWDQKLEEEMRRTDPLEGVRGLDKKAFFELLFFKGMQGFEKWTGWATQNKNGILWNKNEAYYHKRRALKEGDNIEISKPIATLFSGKLENSSSKASVRDLFP